MKTLPGFLALVLAVVICILGGCVNESTQSAPLDTLTMHQFGRVSLVFSGVFQKEVTEYLSKETLTDTGKIILFTNYPSTWVGNMITCGYDYSHYSGPTPQNPRADSRLREGYLMIRDSISPLNEMTGSFYSRDSTYGETHSGMVYEDYSTLQKISFHSIPLSHFGSDTLVFSLKGKILQDHIGTPELVKLNNHEHTSEKLLNVIWDTQPAPELLIILSK